MFDTPHFTGTTNHIVAKLLINAEDHTLALLIGNFGVLIRIESM